MIKCYCNNCPTGYCSSIDGCYKSYHDKSKSNDNIVLKGCLTEHIKINGCSTQFFCCDYNLCNSNTTTHSNQIVIFNTKYSNSNYYNLSVNVILPICLILLTIALVCAFLIRKYHDYLSRYFKIYSSFSVTVNERGENYMKPFINYEDNQSRFVTNSSGLLQLSEMGNEKQIIQCNSCTSGSGSGMPFLVQRTIARQVQLVSAIGKGRFGEVWKGTYYGESVAVKIFASRDEMSWARETHIYNTFLLRHPNVLGYYASDVVSMYGCTQLWLITQYHELGSLYDYLHVNILSLDECLRILLSISSGLCHLHTEILSGPHGKPAIAHRDLKSKNILVIRPGESCVADLGLSVLKSPQQACASNSSCSILPLMGSDSKHKVGTRRYMAPEILMDCLCTDIESNNGLELNSIRYNDITSCPTAMGIGSAMVPSSNQEGSINMNHSSCPINFQHFLTSDIFAFSLIMWEVISRTVLFESNMPDEYRVPFYDQIPLDPSTAEMRQLICYDKLRPPLPVLAAQNVVVAVNELLQLIQECWAEKSHSRPTALRIKKNLKNILLNL